MSAHHAIAPVPTAPLQRALDDLDALDSSIAQLLSDTLDVTPAWAGDERRLAHV